MVHLIRSGGGGVPTWTSRKTIRIAANSLYHDDDSLIASLAKKGKFDLLRQELNDMPNDRFLESISISKLQENHSSILHVVLAHCPPLHIVELILSRMKECCGDDAAADADAADNYDLTTTSAYPVPEEIMDATGKTPLHLAVASGCDVTVIDRLLSGVSLLVPALTKDRLDRYPLHWACCRPHYSTKSRGGGGGGMSYRAERENCRETIYLLLNTYPVAVVIPDVHGKTPLDYAQENKLDTRIMDALQTVAKHYKHYKVGRQLAAVTTAAAASANRAPPTKQPKSKTLLKRKLLLGKCRAPPATAAAAVVGPHTSEMTTERDSTDNDDGNRSSSNDEGDEDEDKVSLPAGLLTISSSSNLSHGRNTLLRLDSMDDLSTLGWDVLSATAAAPATTTKRLSSGPIVRVKTLTVSPTPVQVAATTSGAVISSHVCCRCKSLLRGRLKDKRSSRSSKGRRRVSKRTSRNQVVVATATTPSVAPSVEQTLEKLDQEQDVYSRRFISV